MPDWRAVTRSVAQRVGIDPDIFERQIDQESGFNPSAVSPAGARGIAQIVPSAHPNVDPMNPVEALTYAATWIKSLLRQYGGDYAKALAAYNAGPGAVEKYGGVPPFKETQDYVRIILGGLGPRKAEAAELDENGGRKPDYETPTMRQYGVIPDQGGTKVASPQSTVVPAPPELQAAERVKGNPISIRVLNEMVADPQDPQGPKIPNLSPTRRYLFRDGTYIDIKSVSAGVSGSDQADHYEVVGGTALASTAKPPAAATPHTVERVVALPDGTKVKRTFERDPQTGAYKPVEGIPDEPVAPTKAAAGTTVNTSANEPFIVTRNPDGSLSQEENPNYVPPKAEAGYSTHQIGGRLYTTDKQGNVVRTVDVRTPEEVQAAGLGVRKTQLDIQKTERDLLPKQQQVIQAHYDTVEYVRGMLERGEITPSQADAYVAASRAASEAAIQGTTPFEMKKAEDEARQKRERMGVDILNQRIASTGTIGSSLLSAASSLASHAMLRPGQTSLGVDPLGGALAFMRDANQQAQTDPVVAALLSGATARQSAPAVPSGTPAFPPSGGS